MHGAGGWREGEREEFGRGSLDVPACTGPAAGCGLSLETAFLIKSKFSFIAVKGGCVIIQHGAYETGRSAETLRKEQSAITGRRRDAAAGLGPPGPGLCRRCQACRHLQRAEARGHPACPVTFARDGGRCGSSSGCPGGLGVALQRGSNPLPGRAPGQFGLSGP